MQEAAPCWVPSPVPTNLPCLAVSRSWAQVAGRRTWHPLGWEPQLGPSPGPGFKVLLSAALPAPAGPKRELGQGLGCLGPSWSQQPQLAGGWAGVTQHGKGTAPRHAVPPLQRRPRPAPLADTISSSKRSKQDRQKATATKLAVNFPCALHCPFFRARSFLQLE